MTWNEDCDDCMTNPFTLDAIETKEKLDEDKVSAGKVIAKLDEIDEKINQMGDVHNQKIDFDRAIETLKNVEINQNKLESEEVLLTERKKRLVSSVYGNGSL